jgi:hypothetical protein
MLARRHDPMVAAWHPGAAHRPEALYCVTPWTDPSDRCHSPVGQMSLGLADADRRELRAALTARLIIGRRRPARVRPGLLVTVEAHGAGGQPLRDAILRSWRQSDE